MCITFCCCPIDVDNDADDNDNMHPQHMHDLVMCQESGSQMLTALKGFVNMVLYGKCRMIPSSSVVGS